MSYGGWEEEDTHTAVRVAADVGSSSSTDL